MSIYKSREGKQKLLSLYDQQMEQLFWAWKDLYADATFGRTHLVETGKPNGGYQERPEGESVPLS